MTSGSSSHAGLVSRGLDSRPPFAEDARVDRASVVRRIQ